jgi:diadenosine tetraphosphate (Ap4A) HIT family hydrolase
MPCPFCGIANAYPPQPPSQAAPALPPLEPQQRSHAFLILSTKHVLAFLDIMPLSKGHILVTTRDHYEKVGALGVRMGQEVSHHHLHHHR